MKLVDLTPIENGWRAKLYMHEVDHYGEGGTVGEALISLGQQLVSRDPASRQSLISGLVADLSKI